MKKPNGRIVIGGAAIVAAVAIGGGVVVASNDDNAVETVAEDATESAPDVVIDADSAPESPPRPTEDPLLGPSKKEADDDSEKDKDDSNAQESVAPEPTTTSQAAPRSFETTTVQPSSPDVADYKAPLETEPPAYARPSPTTETSEVPLPDDVQEAMDKQQAGQAGAIPGRHVAGENEEDEPEVQQTGRDEAAEDSEPAPQEPVAASPADGDAPAQDATVIDEQNPELPDQGPTNNDASPQPVPQQPDHSPAPIEDPAPPAPVETAPVLPSAAEIDQALHGTLRPGASDAQIASAFEAGASRIIAGRILAEGAAMFSGAVSWNIVGPVVPSAEGVDATLAVSTPLGAVQVPVTLIGDGEGWKISESSMPTIADLLPLP